jgi:hypothetical protein
MEEQKILHEEDGPLSSILKSSEVEVGSRVKYISWASAYNIEGKSLVVLQVSCKIVYNKELEYWKLVNTYNSDVVKGKESWLKEDISNAEVFRAAFTIFRKDRYVRGGGSFICVKNIIACTEVWVDDDFEMIAVEVKGKDPKYTWEIIDIYSIIGGDFNITQAGWEREAEKVSGY